MGSTPVFEGSCASNVLWAPPQCADYTGAHLKCPCTGACSTVAILVEVGEMVRELLHHLDMHKLSIGLDGILPRVPRDLSEELAKPLSIIYDEQCWLTREVPVDCILALVMPIPKGWKKDLGNYRPFSLISVPGKVMEQPILSAIMWHMQDSQEIKAQPVWVYEKQALLE